MSEVFISYKSERRRAAEHLATVLDCHGYSVWFDYHLVEGRDFGLQIDRKIREAKALIALWCSLSVASSWVAEEVDLAHKLGVLIPVKIEPCELRVGFRRHHYIDLSDWDGAPRGHHLDRLLDALEEKIGRSRHTDDKRLRAYDATWRRFGAPTLKSFALDRPLEIDASDLASPTSVRTRSVKPQSTSKTLLVLAAQEWPAVRDSGDAQRLRRFEEHFANTYYAEEARELRKKIEASRDDRVRPAVQLPPDLAQTTKLIRRDAPDFRPQSPTGRTRFIKDFPAAPEMLVVPPGEFLMGTADGGAEGDALPRHRVKIARPFAASVAPITRGEFAWFAAETNFKTGDEEEGSWRNPGFTQSDDHPVVCVSWYDACEYVAWLRERSGGRAYRLLSEAEWEYCCRAGTTSAYSMGATLTPDAAHFSSHLLAYTTPVSRFRPNPWGFRDMHGNVWEWCEDKWHPNYDGAPVDGAAWITGKADFRILRGGAWDSPAQSLGSAWRRHGRPDGRDPNVGFRVARTMTS